MKAQLDSFDKQIETFKGTQKDLSKILADRSKLQDEYDKATGNNRAGKAYGGAKLTGDQRDGVKNADADRDILLSQAKLDRAELTKQHGFLEQDEVDYLNKVQSINETAIDAKLKLIQGSNAEERKLIADLKLERITDEQDTSQKIYDIRQKQLQDQLDQDKRAVQEANNNVQQDINSTDGRKAQSKLDTDTHLLILQENYNNAIDELEKQTGRHSIKNTKDNGEAIKNLKGDILKDQKDLNQSALADIDKQTDDAIVEIKLKYDKLRKQILDSKASVSDKSLGIAALDKSEGIEVAGTSLKGLNQKVLSAANLLGDGKITKKQFEEIYDAAVKGQKDLTDKVNEGVKSYTTLDGLISGKLVNGLEKLFKFDPNDGGAGTAKAKLFAETISQAFSVAKAAENDFFDNEQQRLEASTAAEIKKLESEKEIAKERATTQAQKDAIDKQFAAKEDAVNREAFEKKKKIDIEMAFINLASQLSNIAVSASSPGPLNILTGGAAAPLLYAAQAAIAEATFLLNVSKIRKATYAYGGNPDIDTIWGGRVKGRSHSRGGNPFMFKGRIFEDEVDELNVIRTKDASPTAQYTISGTHTQIASKLNQLGGGFGFAPGATYKMLEYGGNLGESLRAPVFVSSRTASTSRDVETVRELRQQNALLAANLNATNARIDRLQVVQVTSTVTNAQKKAVKQHSIGTL